MALSELLRDYVTTYQCGVSLYNLNGDPEAKQLAETGKAKLISLLK